MDEPDKGLLHPRFNCISPRICPGRDTYLDQVAAVLVPDAKGSWGDSSCVDQGRSALVGFLQYLIALINDDDPDRYADPPERWHGHEASLPMLVEWLALSEQEASRAVDDASAEGSAPVDGLRVYLRRLLEQASERNYPRICVINLQPLVEMGDKQRSGVLGTMHPALMPFRNSAVAERTSGSDFAPCDLGGRLSAAALRELSPFTLPSPGPLGPAPVRRLSFRTRSPGLCRGAGRGWGGRPSSRATPVSAGHRIPK